MEAVNNLEEMMEFLDKWGYQHPPAWMLEECDWWARKAYQSQTGKAGADGLPQVYIRFLTEEEVEQGHVEGGFYIPQWGMIIVESSREAMENFMVHELTHWHQQCVSNTMGVLLEQGEDAYVDLPHEVQARMAQAMHLAQSLDLGSPLGALAYDATTWHVWEGARQLRAKHRPPQQ